MDDKSAIGPIVVDMGRKSSKKIRKLRKGGGPLAVAAMNTFEALKEEGRVDANAVPVLIVVRERNPWKRMARKWYPFKF